jgi:hypothetical protein
MARKGATNIYLKTLEKFMLFILIYQGIIMIPKGGKTIYGTHLNKFLKLHKVASPTKPKP